MNDDHKDRILDACLLEILAGESPPDLTDRILAALETVHTSDGDGVDAWLPPPSHPPAAPRSVEARPLNAPTTQPPAPSAPPIQAPRPQATVGFPVVVKSGAAAASPNGRAVATRRPESGGSRHWSAIVIAATVLITGGGLGWLALHLSKPHDRIAQEPARVEDPVPRPEPSPALQPDGPGIIDQDEGDILVPVEPSLAEVRPSPAPDRVVPVRPPRLPDASIVASINARIAELWNDRKVVPAQPESPQGWARRVCLQLLGREPSAEEYSQLAGTDRAALVRQLLQANTPQFAEHWAGILAKDLMSGTPGDGRVNRDGLRQYLTESLTQGKSYDQLTRELITAVGSVDPDEPDFNGATNFLAGGFDHDREVATAKVARVFLGKQLDCVSCHDSKVPQNSVAQRQFWELNAFFWQLQLVDAEGSTQLVDRDFDGEHGSTPQEAEIYFKDPNQRVWAAYPVFVDGQRISPSGLLAEVNRRTELARLVTQSSDFGRATVNRLWARMLGFGFCNPIDDLGPHNPPSHPELLAELSEQFTAHDFDLQRLLSWIAASDAFGLSSDGGSNLDTPAMGGAALFARYYAREEHAATADESLRLLVKRMTHNEFNAQEHARLIDFARVFGVPGEAGKEPGRPSIIAEGAVEERLASHEPPPAIGSLIAGNLPLAQKIEHLYRAAIGRRPTSDEVDNVVKLVGSRGSNTDGWRIIWWTLVNSRP